MSGWLGDLVGTTMLSLRTHLFSFRFSPELDGENNRRNERQKSELIFLSASRFKLSMTAT